MEVYANAQAEFPTFP
jgi:hypothetical protein